MTRRNRILRKTPWFDVHGAFCVRIVDRDMSFCLDGLRYHFELPRAVKRVRFVFMCDFDVDGIECCRNSSVSGAIWWDGETWNRVHWGVRDFVPRGTSWMTLEVEW